MEIGVVLDPDDLDGLTLLGSRYRQAVADVELDVVHVRVEKDQVTGLHLVEGYLMFLEELRLGQVR